MKKRLKNIWKHSRLRFYVLNAMWNYSFWLHAKKMYKQINYEENTGNFESDVYLFVSEKKKKFTKRVFVGYFFKNGIYLDNPGLKIDDRETWEAWKSKGLIK